MKKFLKSMVVMCIATSMLLTSVQGVFAKALDGEVVKQIDYRYGKEPNWAYKKVNIVIPEKYANYDLYPNMITVGSYAVFEDEILDGQTYKWINTVEADKARGILDEFVLVKDDGNPFYEVDDTKRIDYSERYYGDRIGKVSSALNPYAHYGKNASDMLLFIDGSLRSFKTAYYPMRSLINHSISIQGPDARMPMVGIREFVDSVSYMSLIWDNGRITLTNSKTGLNTVFSIYSNTTDVKAVLIDGVSYASLDDLLIAQFSYPVYSSYRCISHLKSDNLAYYKPEGDMVSVFSKMYEAYSSVGAMSMFMLEQMLSEHNLRGYSTSATGDILAKKSWVNYNKEDSLKVFNMLENYVNPNGCIYDGECITAFTIGATDVNYWKEQMLKVTSKYSTDKEKAENLAKYLNSVFFHLDYASSSYNADDAVKDKMFVGVCSDIADLYCIGLGQAGVPSVVINGKNKTNTVHGLSQGHAINGVYYDGAWHYYDVSSFMDKSKDVLTDTFFADAIWGLTETDDVMPASSYENLNELNKRYNKLGYLRAN